MKLVLHNYWRSSASHRVRIGARPQGARVRVRRRSTSSRREQHADGVPREEPDGAGADARDHRGRRHASARSRSRWRSSSTSRSASPSRRSCRAIRTCARARASSPRSSTRASSRCRTCRRRSQVKALGGDDAAWVAQLHRRRARGVRARGRRDRRRVLRRRRADDRGLLPRAAARSARVGSASTLDAPMPSCSRSRQRCLALPAFARRRARSPARRRAGEVKDERPMAKLASLGIKRLEGIHYYVHDLERCAASTPRSSTSPRPGASTPELEAQGRASASACFSGRRHQCRVLRRRSARAAARRASCEAPRRRRHADLRGRGHRAHVRAARGARRHADRRHRRRSQDDGGTLRQFSITTPFGDTTFRFRRAPTATARCSRAAVAARRRAAATNTFGFDADRSRHVELPDDEADAAVARARAGLRAALGGRVPHHRRRAGAQDRLGPQVDRDVGPGDRT